MKISFSNFSTTIQSSFNKLSKPCKTAIGLLAFGALASLVVYKRYGDPSKNAPESEGNEAKYQYALKLMGGNGVKQDHKGAMNLLLEAAENGHIKAMFTYAKFLEYSHEKKPEEVEKWYTKAAEQGETEAVKALARLKKKNTKKSLENTREWYSKAAEEGDTNAMHILAAKLKKKDTQEDLEKAREWYNKAAEKGDTRAMRHLADMYEKGEGGLIDGEIAKKWREKAIEQESLKKKNADYKAAENNDIGAMNRLIDMLVLEGGEENLKEAKKWREKAVEQESLKKKREELTIAAENNDIGAMHELAMMCSGGIGGQVNIQEAERWDNRVESLNAEQNPSDY